MQSSLSYMDVGGPVMWAILAISVMGCAIVFERALFLLMTRPPAPPSVLPGEAGALGLSAERAVRAEAARLGARLPLLGLIVRAAPMLGLLGTVLGMADMFASLGAGGGIDAMTVTEGIRLALSTTIAGLSCAVPLLVAGGLLDVAIERRVERLERAWDEAIARRLSHGESSDA